MASKITLYEHKDFHGRSIVLTESCPHLQNVGFHDIASSVRCQKGVWVIYQDTHYRGNIFVVHADEEYNLSFRMDFNDKASSVKLIDGYDFTEEPECTVFKHNHFKGRSLNFRNDVHNLKHYDFNDEISSIVVKSGAWVGFKDSNFEGEQTLFLKGNYILSDRPKDQGGFNNDSLSSFSRIMVKPSGKVKLLRIDYDCDKKQVLRKPDEVFKWVQDNYTSIEQMVKRTDEETKQREDTYEFRWNSTTKVSATVTAKIGIPLIEKEGVKMTAEESFDVGSTSGTKTVKVQKFVVEYPSKIPPYSRITLTSKVTEGKIDIPFTAFMCYEDNPDHVITEKGVFYGCQYFDFHTEFHETKLH